MRKMALVLFVAAAMGTAGCGGKKQELTLKGSDTMLQVGQSWAEKFQQEHPGMQVSVTGGGSGTGISALINRHAAIAMSSRKIKDDEIALAPANSKPKEFVVGQDGIAVVVNNSNPLSELTMEQLRKIFTGEVKNWNQVGGPDRGIVILSRETSSGTYIFFREHVLANKDYAANALLMPSTSVLVNTAASNESAIGYSGLAYAEEADVKIIGVKKNAGSPAVVPCAETIRDGSYPISRPLLLYTLGEPSGDARAFIDFAMGGEGQKILKEVGYIPLK